MIDLLSSFDPLLLITFVTAGLLLNLTPGVDFVYVSASGLQGGPRIGMAAALGVNLGIAVHVLAAAAGLSALLLAWPGAYLTIKLIGAAYLLYLAWQAWFTRSGPLGTTAPASVRRAIWRGFLTNILNPKTALFIFAFIPQFTDPTIGPIWAQILILGAIFLINGLVFSTCLGALVGVLAQTISGRLRSQGTRLNKLTAILFAGLAARLIID